MQTACLGAALGAELLQLLGAGLTSVELNLLLCTGRVSFVIGLLSRVTAEPRRNRLLETTRDFPCACGTNACCCCCEPRGDLVWHNRSEGT